jgi:hypothetical protein
MRQSTESLASTWLQEKPGFSCASQDEAAKNLFLVYQLTGSWSPTDTDASAPRSGTLSSAIGSRLASFLGPSVAVGRAA